MFSAQLSYDVKIEARSATPAVMPNGRSSGEHCDEAQQAAPARIDRRSALGAP